MLRIDMIRKPGWHDMPGGMRPNLLLVTTALIAYARRDPDVVAVTQRVPPEADDATPEANPAAEGAADEAVAGNHAIL